MKKLLSIGLLFIGACIIGLGVATVTADYTSACWDCSPQPNNCSGTCVSASTLHYWACPYPNLCCCTGATPIAVYQSTQICDGVRCWVKTGCMEDCREVIGSQSLDN